MAVARAGCALVAQSADHFTAVAGRATAAGSTPDAVAEVDAVRQ
ncbi:hypothetical protein [Catenuloplanes japonicus]|nr:hypothetical protein [Catenuloplanes japonicus]